MPEMNIIGLDVHSATFTTRVIDGVDGRCLGGRQLRTSEENLIAEVSRVPGPKWLVVEECHLAQWVKLTLEEHVDRLTICDPRRNRDLAEADFIDDERSALKLAELARLGALKEVYHPDEGLGQIRSLFLHYHDLDQNLTRFKNKLKATYRQVAIDTTGSAIYKGGKRETWVEKLCGEPHLRTRAEDFFALIDELERAKQNTYTSMVSRARKLPPFDLLMGVPGVGEVTATGYVGILVTPHRFATKSKLWGYAGYGKRRKESDGVVYEEGRRKSYNRALHWLTGQQFQAAVHRSKKPNRFKRLYEAHLARGLSEDEAECMVCQSQLSVVRTVWMKGEAYRVDS